jgi:hypothetical protein
MFSVLHSGVFQTASIDSEAGALPPFREKEVVCPDCVIYPDVMIKILALLFLQT